MPFGYKLFVKETDLYELERMRVHTMSARQWFASHQDVDAVLEHLQQVVQGTNQRFFDWSEVRQRVRQLNGLDPFTGEHPEGKTLLKNVPRPLLEQTLYEKEMLNQRNKALTTDCARLLSSLRDLVTALTAGSSVAGVLPKVLNTIASIQE